MDISEEILHSVYSQQLNDTTGDTDTTRNIHPPNGSHAEMWYNAESPTTSLQPMAVMVAVWQLFGAAAILLASLTSSSLRRRPRAMVISVHLAILLVTSGALVKLPLVYGEQRVVNPFTWHADPAFCRVHPVVVQFVISALPLVVIAIAADAIVWLRHPTCFHDCMALPRGRVAALFAPWSAATIVTLAVVLYTMPSGGHLVSGRCIPAFVANRIVAFLVLVLLGRFFMPILGVAASTVVLIRTTRRHLRSHSPPHSAPPAVERHFLTTTATYSRGRVIHACVSVTITCILYACMVGPHYAQLLFLRIPGVAKNFDYNRLANVGYIAVFIHEAFWNLLPLLWVLLQFDVLNVLFKNCICCYMQKNSSSSMEDCPRGDVLGSTAVELLTNEKANDIKSITEKTKEVQY